MSVNAISTAQMLGGIEILGMEVKSDRDLEKAVVHGLPTDAVALIVGQIYPGQTDKFYELVPRSTLIRRQKEGSLLSMEESQRAERLARTFSFAIEVWGNEAKAREFMQKSHPMLEDRTPFEASLNELGARQVEQLLGRLMFGISAQMTASVLDRTLKAYRIGIHNNRYPIFDGTGAKMYPGRWNNNHRVIYCGENYSLAMLEKLVHSNTGDIPKYQQWIEITIPVETTYEIVTTYSLPNWKESSVSKAFGDEWLDSNRSCILIVPSAIAPIENNILINEAHSQFLSIKTSLNRPVLWDRRLFFPPQQ